MSATAWRSSMIARLLHGQRPDGSFGLHPYSKWSGQQAAQRGVELLLEHRLFRSLATGDSIHPEWTLARKLSDPRARDALDLLRSQRRRDGTWAANGRRHWRKAGRTGVEAVDWGDAHQIATPVAEALVA